MIHARQPEYYEAINVSNVSGESTVFIEFMLSTIKASLIDALNTSDEMSDEMSAYTGSVTLSLSHGDLQSGNVWVENGTDKIYIIDWESYGKRSAEYDKATLYGGIRRSDKLADYVKVKDDTHATVLLEDLIFRLKELKSLPENFGAEDFKRYVEILEDRYV